MIVQIEETSCGGWMNSTCSSFGDLSNKAEGNVHRRSVQEGQEYLITIGGANGETGILAMTLSLPQ